MSPPPLRKGVVFQMKFEKKRLGDMTRCYCAGHTVIYEKLYVLLASEEPEGPCYAYSGEALSEREALWEYVGGTMSIVEIPETNGQILAVQNFFPGFKSERAKLVWGRRDPQKGWIMRDFLFLPFLHRFDIIRQDGANYFLASVLCGSKKDREDWSDPGRVLVGILPDDLTKPMELTPILTGLTKNHGYCRGVYEGKVCSYITCEGGVYAVVPPQKQGQNWETKQILSTPTSDVAVFDLDGDGKLELATIEPFHGNSMKIYHEDGKGGYTEVYSYPNEMNFAHALWAGKLRGQPAVVLGIRRMESELAVICYDSAADCYTTEILEKGGGPSNVDVVAGAERDLLICANHTKNEAAVYFVTD